MEREIGTCGNCGGSVVVHSGPWFGVCPPPPPECINCGAVPKFYEKPVFDMGNPRNNVNIREKCGYTAVEDKGGICSYMTSCGIGVKKLNDQCPQCNKPTSMAGSVFIKSISELLNRS